MAAKEELLDRVVTYATSEGIAGRSLREIAAGVGTSHRMLIYHFGSHEGLLAAIVAVVEERQRAAMAAITASSDDPVQAMLGLWRQVSAPELRGAVRLFFSVFGLAAQGVAGTETLRASLTEPWLTEGVAAAEHLGVAASPEAIRLGVAVSRGLLLDLVAGADEASVHASYALFLEMFAAWSGGFHRRDHEVRGPKRRRS